MINAEHWNQLPKLLNQFSANNDLVYIEAFFEEKWFHEILAQSRLYRKEVAPDVRLTNLTSSIKPAELTYIPPSDEILFGGLYESKELKEFIQRIVNRPKLSTFNCQRYVVYRPGQGLDWHKDVPTYIDPEYSAILTLENETDSSLQFRDASRQVHTIHTRPNSLLLLKAFRASHKVNPCTYGSRTAIIMEYTPTKTKGPLFYPNIFFYRFLKLFRK